jgi:hypothetical protein
MPMTRVLAMYVSAVLIGAASGWVVLEAGQTAAPSPAAPPRANVSSPQKDALMASLTNKGRWGAADELGALNLITPATRQRALALARTGTVVSLMRAVVPTEKSAAVKADGKPDGTPFFEIRFRTFDRDSFFAGFNSDVQEYAMHGPLLTHLDGLCHDSYHDQLYNGFPMQSSTDPAKGCLKLGAEHLRDGIVTRGVLIDFPRLKGVASVPRGTRLQPTDVEAWERQSGVKIGPGDAIFLYTGRREGQPETGAGYDLSIAPLLKARDVAVVGADGANADHQLTIAGLGVYLIDNVDLSRAADTAARLRRWEFLLTVSPIAVTGATGSLVNPLAIF